MVWFEKMQLQFLLSILFLEMLVNASAESALTERYSKAFGNDFKKCMNGIEQKPIYNGCGGFNATRECHCYFLKEVDGNCKQFESARGNYWYLEQETRNACSPYKMCNQTLLPANNGSSEGGDCKFENIQLQRKDATSNVATQIELESKVPSKNTLPGLAKSYQTDVLRTMDFEKYYEKKRPSAMTIDCNLMKALRPVATATDRHMTHYSSTLLLPGSTQTHTILEVIKVQENSRGLTKRSSNVSVAPITNTTHVLVYSSEASYFHNKIRLLYTVSVSILLYLLSIH